MKYKQTFILSVTIPTEWNTKNSLQLRKIVFEKLKSYKGLVIENHDLKIKITLSVTGFRKMTKGGSMYSKKAALAFCILDLVKYAEYNNFGDRKPTDNKEVIGYLNFKAKCLINGNKENLRLVVQFQKDGKFYYNIEVNKIVSPPEVPL